jgi:hypothetical protein
MRRGLKHSKDNNFVDHTYGPKDCPDEEGDYPGIQNLRFQIPDSRDETCPDEEGSEASGD